MDARLLHHHPQRLHREHLVNRLGALNLHALDIYVGIESKPVRLGLRAAHGHALARRPQALKQRGPVVDIQRPQWRAARTAVGRESHRQRRPVVRERLT